MPRSSQPRGTDLLTVELAGASLLDRRGTFRGPLPPDQRALEFPMAIENGEWRIAEAPDALVVPESWFEQRFRQVSLYFFDPSAQILVPEPVFVQRGEPSTTALTEALLRGPGRRARRDLPQLHPARPRLRPVRAGLGGGRRRHRAARLLRTDDSRGQRADGHPAGVDPAPGARHRGDPGLHRRPAGQPPTAGRACSTSTTRSEYDPTGLDSSHLFYGLDDGLLVVRPARDAGPGERTDGRRPTRARARSPSTSTAPPSPACRRGRRSRC